MSKERPDLEEQKAEIIQSNNDNKIKMKTLEDGILQQLAEAEGDVTENLTLIENLEDSKRVSTEIAEKMLIAVETEKKINASRENYRMVARRGALMFFLLSELNKLQKVSLSNKVRQDYRVHMIMDNLPAATKMIAEMPDGTKKDM